MSLIPWEGCPPCGLRKEWQYLLHPQMPIAIPEEETPFRVLLQGEAPGSQEDKKGIPFIGESGQYLRKEIPHYWKKKLYWTNTVRCQPPRNRTPEPKEQECCSVYLRRDLDIIKPQAILLLGDIALKAYWPSAWISGMRKIPFPIKLPCGITTWAMGCYHPSYIARQDKEDFETGKVTNAYLPVFRSDLKFFFDQIPYFADNPPKIYDPPVKTIVYPRNPTEVRSLFERLKKPIAVDLETSRLKPYMRDARIITAGFSDGELTFSFPVNWPGQLFGWGLEVFNEIIQKAGQWIAQHASFEYAWIWSYTKTHKHNFDDIEVLARLLHKRSGIGSLDDLSRIYLGFDIKAFTNIDKNRLLEYPIEKVLEYNALDAWAERLIFDILKSKVSSVDLENYHRIIDTIKSTVGMELKGLEVDTDESARLYDHFSSKMHEYDDQSKRMKEVIEYEQTEKRSFSISAPETVGHVIVQYCGYQLPKTEKGKQYSTNEQDLIPLAGKHPLIDLVLSYREVAKLLSTYIEPILKGEVLGADGLLHPSYTVIHSRTYRLSSENPNAQNFPKRKNREVRKQIVAPSGYILAAFDYGQLEGRVVAMFSRDPALKKAFIEDDDLHWKWLYRIIDLYPEYMHRLAKVSGETEEKKILKAGRTIIKTDFVFASLYGSQAKALANRTQIPLHITEKVLGEFWSNYPLAERWVEGQFELYQKTGCVSSLTGRDRNEVLPGNEVTNSPSQGSAAEIVLEAQNALFFQAVEKDINLMPRVNVHDDLIFVLPDDSSLENYIRYIGAEIVKPRFSFITVPLMTECRVGYNWADLEPVTTFSGEYYE